MADPLETRLSTACVAVSNLVSLGQSRLNQTSVINGDPPEKNYPSCLALSRSLKVIRTDMDRSATYDFLLVIHRNMGLYGTFSAISSHFSEQSQNFPTPCILRHR